MKNGPALISVLAALGRIVQRQAMPDSALALFREGLQLAEQLQDTAGIGTMWLNLGAGHEVKGDYPAALDAQLNALRWKELGTLVLSNGHAVPVSHRRRAEVLEALGRKALRS